MAYDARLLARHPDLLAERHNLAATTAPGATDDETSHYGRGSIWVNQATGAVYMCMDSTTGAAVWEPIGGIDNSMLWAITFGG